jgi:MFS superfamily sulfate permease-like transporter
MPFLSRIRVLQTNNLQTLRSQPLAELSGSLGDLGTLLPLLVALSINHSISLPSTLVFAGLANVATGILFGIPLPVQPMKAIAAIAISKHFTIEETSAAGITVSVFVLLLSVTGLVEWFSRVIPIPVVKGIQVGAGLSLVLSGGSNLLAQVSWVDPSWADNHCWTLFAFLFLLISTTFAPRRVQIPYALVTFVLGVVLAAATIPPSHQGDGIPPLAIWRPRTYLPPMETFGTTLSASLGQLPLTTLNSIIAVCHLSSDLLPNLPEPSATSIGLSVATMNLVGCWFGAMPACHGSGGLAAQYRFGARSGASIIILGLIKLLLGLFVGDALIVLLELFPKSLLGIMVIAAGIELAKVGESLNTTARDLWEISTTDNEGVLVKTHRELSDEERKARWSVMLVTVAGLLAFRNDAIGFLAGLIWHWGLRAPEYLASRRERRSWMRSRLQNEGDGLLRENHPISED